MASQGPAVRQLVLGDESRSRKVVGKVGQRGIRNLYNSGLDLYWKQFYFLNAKSYNWLWQVMLVRSFCQYLLVWVLQASRFVTKGGGQFLKAPLAPSYYYRYYR